MSFFKKMGKVLNETATKITETKNELSKVYEKDSWVGLMDVAEKKIDVMNEATNNYIDNLKTVNEKVINDVAKNSNSTFEAIWRSTFAVSKETFTFVGKDLKDQALKVYKAWENVEVEKNFTPELNLLFQASSAVKPEDLMTYCGALRNGAIYSISHIQVEIYGEIWFDLKAPDKRFTGSLPLLQHILLNTLEENVSDDFLLKQCLNIMYKIPEVAERYEVLYAEYLAENPSITRLDTPFEQREEDKIESTESIEGESKPLISPDLKASGVEALNKIKGETTVYLKKGKDLVTGFASKYTTTTEKPNEEDAVSGQPEPVKDSGVVHVEGAEEYFDLNKVEEEIQKLEKLKNEIQAKNAMSVKEGVAPKPARKTVAKKTVKTEEGVAPKPTRKAVAKKAVKTEEGVAPKPARKTATKKATKTEEGVAPKSARKTATKKTDTEK